MQKFGVMESVDDETVDNLVRELLPGPVRDMAHARFKAGEAVYGPLDLTVDKRDFHQEALEELVDALYYLIAAGSRRRPTITPEAEAVADVIHTLYTRGLV